MHCSGTEFYPKYNSKEHTVYLIKQIIFTEHEINKKIKRIVIVI